MMENFNATIDKIVADTEVKMLNVVKNSIEEVVEDAQTPLTKGGKMHVDTGFLRHSGTATLNDMPVGPTKGRKRAEGEFGVLPEYEMKTKGSYVTDVLTKMKLGDTFYFGWTAKYALIREIYDGFMDCAVMKWQQVVDRQLRRLKK